MQWVTLSGGEPLTRKDWPEIAAGLRRNGIIPNMISNGWLLSDDMVAKVRDAGIGTMAISLDGLEETHDGIRKAGSFGRARKAFAALKAAGVHTGAITTLNRRNMPELPRLRETLEEWGVDSWQLQVGIPMGSMSEHRDLILPRDATQGILDFCLETALRRRIRVFPADCLGYFSPEEELVRQIGMDAPGPVRWEGCNAGKRSFGLLHDGDVLGCTSIRDRTLVEGNVRERPLDEIWNDPTRFVWAREMRRTDLAGACLECVHGEVCLGGCPNSRLTMNGSMRSESPWCAYADATRRTRGLLEGRTDSEELLARARKYVSEGEDQLALLVLDRVAELGVRGVEALAIQGFVHFRMGHFDRCVEANQMLLQREPGHSYAMNGMGMAMVRLGQVQDGIAWMERAVQHAGPEFPDPGHDLAVIRRELGIPA
jgi:radical SAM protein with 4Fe4S-binding SPASM domain